MLTTNFCVNNKLPNVNYKSVNVNNTIENENIAASCKKNNNTVREKKAKKSLNLQQTAKYKQHAAERKQILLMQCKQHAA